MDNRPIDIGPGMEMLVDQLDGESGDVAMRLDLPNGWGASIIRTQPTIVEIPGYKPQPAGGSIGASAGLFEVALTRRGEVVFDGPMLREPKGHLTSTDVARKVREIFELPESR
jgi:hypothetical protein